ncbi:MAG: hypothetical protein P8Y58_09405 [Novosphingobium sp.]
MQKGPSTRDEHAGYDFETEERDGKRDMAKVNSSDDENMPVGAGSSELRMWVRLLASQVNPKDARSAIVSLTAAGKRHFLELAEAHHRWISEIFADVSDADKDDLVRMLGNLRTLMTEPR